MVFKYNIVFISQLDRFNGLPLPYNGQPVPAEHRLYFTHELSNQLKHILFDDNLDSSDIISVREVMRLIPAYDDIAEALVTADIHRYWTRDRHTHFTNAFKFFTDNNFHISF